MLDSLNSEMTPSKNMSKTRQTVNPFDYLPEDKLQIIREDYEKGAYRSESFGEHLKSLHEDDLIPEEALDIIEAQKSNDWKTFSTVEELLQDLHNDE